MTVKLTQITQATQLLKIVSVRDGAIDWNESLPDVQGDEFLKRATYLLHRDVSKLAYKEGEVPTLFVFEHPKRADVSRKMRQTLAQIRAGNEGNELYEDLYNAAFLGTEEGFQATRIQAPRINGKIVQGYFQGLLDAEVFVEVASAFMYAANATKADTEVNEKK